METLPPEIHALIFSYACTFPSTSASLALVSKYFKAASDPFKWTHVALHSYDQVLMFAKAVEGGHKAKSTSGKGKSVAGRRPLHSTCKEAIASSNTQQVVPIHHLFVSDRDSRRYTTCPSDCDPTHFSLQYVSRYNQFPPALKSILTYAADSLMTLSFFSDSHSFEESASSVRAMLSVTYPCIRELTIRACCTPAQLLGPPEVEKFTPYAIPVLRRLHLALPYHGFDNGNLNATHRLVEAIAPRAFPSRENDASDGAPGEGAEPGDTTPSALSHLRFTMLDKWGSKRVVEVIHAELAESHIVPAALALPVPPPDWDIPLNASAVRVTWPRLLPPGLARFAIQPSPTSTFYCSCCMDLRGDVDVMRVLARMAAVADRDRFLCLDRRPIRVRRCRTDPMEVAGYGFVEARADWMERVHGEEGCWRAKEDFESEVDSEEVTRTPASPIPMTRNSKKGGRPRVLITRVGNAFRKLKMW